MIYWICFIILFPFITLLFPTRVVNKKRLPKEKKQIEKNQKTMGDEEEKELKCKILEKKYKKF